MTVANQESDVAKKIRNQFDAVCYPNTPLENSPKDDYQSLYIHNLVTSYYLRNQKVIKTQGKVILDAGCGSGYKSLILAHANPSAKIIGIDFAEESVKLARQRLQYHGFENVEFYAIPIEELPSLGLEFDYINCDEVLYLLPDIVAGLQAMKSVLKTDGIIRTNLHSSLQRFAYFRAQEVLKDMGLMDENPGEMEMELARETMTSLKDQVLLKALTWNPEKAVDDQWMQMNYLLQGDKGYTITEVFSALRDTNLEFISMVNWRYWEVMDLFKDPENLSPFLAMSLPDLSVEARLHLYEMLHPVHRLIDFWCGNANHAQSFIPLWEWSLSDWQNAQVHLHPQLQTTQVKEDLIKCINRNSSFEISRYLPLPTLIPILIDSSLAACLLPLWEGTQSVVCLVERWLKLRALHPVTLEPVSKEMAWDEIKELLKKLEVFIYVMLERLP
ncbi:MAG TPA: class I SAM-dependent methyltransferase [Kamptonema sp.]|nr:class I SAM-dependent methyltransferase [Kamptonema sp.]